MPRLNRFGSVLAGNGDWISVNKIPLVKGAVNDWLTDEIFIFNGYDADDKWHLYQYNCITQTVSLVNNTGPNYLVASDGLWAAQAGGSLYGNFLYSSNSRMSLTSTDGRGASNRNGYVALSSNPDCNAFDIYGHEGKVNHINAIAYNLFILSPQELIWNGGSFGYEVHTSIQLTNRKVIKLSDGDWIIGWSGKFGLIAQLNGASDGYVLSNVAYHYDAIALEDQLVVAWCTNVLETQDSVVKVTVNRAAPRIPLVDDQPIPPDPIPPIPPIPPDPEPIPPDPIPEPPVEKYPTAKEYKMSDSKTIAIRGPKGLYLTVTPDTKGQGPFRGYKLGFTATEIGDNEKFTLSQPDSKFQINHIPTNAILGADATQYSDSLEHQLYTIEARGPYESWNVYYDPNKKRIEGVVDYDNQYVSIAITIVEL